MIYEILDFNAVTKHSYYGQKGRTQDTLICEKTGEEVVNWHAAVNDFLSRYMANFQNPRDILVAHDMGIEYRKAFFPGYKVKTSTKEQSPLEQEMIAKTRDWIKNFLSALGATQIGVQGVEADDVIAWLVAGQDVSAVVHTVDADLLQLVSDSCAVSLKGELHVAGGYHKEIPYPLTSFSKSILGDPSDCYKGIPGMGPAKFSEIMDTVPLDELFIVEKLLAGNEFKSAETLLSPYTESKAVQMLLANWSEWYAQYRLASLHPELCYRPRGGKLTKPLIHKRIPNSERVKNLLNQVGANDLWEERYQGMVPTRKLLSSENWAEVKEQVKEQILEGRIVAYDYETSDKNPKQRFRKASTANFVDVLSQEITGMSICCGEFNQYTYYMTVDHKDSPNLTNEDVKELLIFMARNANKVTPVAHNASFEGVVTQKQLGIAFGGVHDTRVMQRYYDENSSAGLKDMSLQYLGYHQASYKDTLADAGVTMMCDMTWEQAFDYGADDALVTAQLYDLMKLLLQVDGSWEFYKKWAVEPTQVLQSAHIKGVKINWAMQKRIHEEDLVVIDESLTALRDLLTKEVSGEITDGCLSLVEAEKKFIERSLRDKEVENADEKYQEWKDNLKRACNYVPYMESEVMPAFSFTAKQVSAAAVAVGLPPLEKLTQTAIREYFSVLGLDCFDPPSHTDEQEQFLEMFQEAVEARIDKLSKEPTAWRQEVFDKFGKLCQTLAGVEPRVIKVGDELNMNSSKQMQELMYCKIGVPVRLFGKLSPGRMRLGLREGSPSTDEKAIETALVLDAKGWQVDALNLMLKAKSALTRVTLFHNKLPLWVHDDGRIHPFITDAGTDTRRPTGGAPNILQIPSRGPMRSLWMPPTPDYVCVAIDFSGQELRIMASESQDPVMMDAYTPGAEKDIHSTTGVGIAKRLAVRNPDLHHISDFETFEAARRDETHKYHSLASGIRGKEAKGLNFSLCYISGVPSIARNLIIPLDIAEELHVGTLTLYKGVPIWQKATAKFMEKEGYTQTAWGTKRHATEDLFSKDKGKVSRVHRQGVNAVIQGAAAESLRTILTRLHTERWIYTLRMEFFAPIYDEIVAWVHKDDVVQYCDVMYKLMVEATPPGHEIPQVPEFSIGPDWGRCHELGQKPSEERILRAVEDAINEGVEVWETDMALSYEQVYGKTPEEMALT